MCGEMDFCGLALIVEYPLQLTLFCTLDGVQEFEIELFQNSLNLQYCLLIWKERPDYDLVKFPFFLYLNSDVTTFDPLLSVSNKKVYLN